MIPYHGSPVSGPMDAAARFYRGRHVLVSFAYPSHLPIVASVCKSFILDCGAFTHWRQGKGEVDVDAYIGWVREWERHPAFDWAIVPDVIDGDEEANQALLSQCLNKFDGVPVWHLHESLLRLNCLCGEFKRVALGSSGEWSRPGATAWWERMNDVMASICIDGRPKTKLHGLRMLAPSIAKRLPLSSADSTNAARNGGDPSRVNRSIASWQRANLIADTIDATIAADRWKPWMPKTEAKELTPLYGNE